MEPVKINSLEFENVKRIRAVQIQPTKDGLTVIGGRNGQGKTSVLDAIAWALGGKKFQPDNPNRDGGATPAKLHVELSNGIVVERRGKNGTLYVTDATGMRGTQKLLDESTLARVRAVMKSGESVTKSMRQRSWSVTACVVRS